MHNPNMLQERIRALCEKQKLAVLATTGDNRPYTSLVAFACSPDMTYLLFATPRTTRKFVNLQSNAKVAFLIHDASDQDADFNRASSLTILGTAAETLLPDKTGYQAEYLQKHPHLEAFVTSKDCAIVRVLIETCVLVTNFQEVHVLQIRPQASPAASDTDRQ